MVISEQQFFDYITCPAMYDMKYNKGMFLNDAPSLKKVLEKASIAFYNQALNTRRAPSFSFLTQKYESLFKPYIGVIPEKKYNDGLFLLRNFYYWASSNRIVVIDSSAKYTLTYKGNILEGIMNPIAIKENNQLEFLIMNYSTRKPEQSNIDRRLKYTIDMVAFNESNQEHIIATKMHHVKSNTDYITTRNKLDEDRLYSALENVCKGIENDIYYPRESIMCDQCLYKNVCRGWKGKEH